MKIEYETTIKFKIVHDVETLKDIKTNSEYAEDLARLICDETAFAGGVATYDILESKFNYNDVMKNVDNATKEKIYNDFMKKGKQ